MILGVCSPQQSGGIKKPRTGELWGMSEQNLGDQGNIRLSMSEHGTWLHSGRVLP